MDATRFCASVNSVKFDPSLPVCSNSREAHAIVMARYVQRTDHPDEIRVARSYSGLGAPCVGGIPPPDPYAWQRIPDLSTGVKERRAHEGSRDQLQARRLALVAARMP